MATSQISEVVHHLRRTVLLREGAGLTDGQLLEDYISRRNEAALAALVWRHGPMVWGVCRRVLRNHHDAEDAFQATFLVLVRKAASIASRDLLANWLYGVAHQTALKARATAAKQKGREKQVADMPEPVVVEQDLWRDLQPLLDAELSRLPDKYRAVIVLCDLEGKTRKEAARQLGCPEGTVAGRLARARVMLAKRLARHGPVVMGGALAVVLAQQVASAGVPTSVVSSTIKAVTLVAAGPAAAAGVISPKVAALTEGVLKAMLFTNLKVVMVLLVVVALSGAVGLIYQTQAGEQPQPKQVKGPTTQADEAKPVVVRDDASIHRLAYSADSKAVATVGITYESIEVKEADGAKEQPIRNSTVKIWDAATGKLKKSLGVEKHTHITAIDFSPDGKTVAVAAAKPAKAGSVELSNVALRLLDAETWALRREVKVDGFVTALAFSPDGERLAFGGGNSSLTENGSFVRLWDMEKAKEVGGTKEQKPDDKGEQGKDKNGYVTCLAFSSDGKMLAAAELDGKISLFDGQTSERKQVWDDHRDFVSGVAFSPDGKTLASGSHDKTVKLWDVRKGKVRQTLQGNKAMVTAVAFCPDGKFLATGGQLWQDDKLAVEVIIWDARTGELKQSLSDLTVPITTVVFSSDGKTLAIGGGNGSDSSGGKASGEVQLLPLDALLRKAKNEKPADDKGEKQNADAGFDQLLLKSAMDDVEREKGELRLAEMSHFGLAQDDLFKKAAAERMERAKANLKRAERNLELAKEAQVKNKPVEKGP